MIRSRSPGFTLIEMAIVFILIGLIAGLIMPAIFKAIERGKTESAQEDLIKLKNEIIGFAIQHSPHRLPTQTEFNGFTNRIDKWGNQIKYWSDSDLYDYNKGVCDQTNARNTNLIVKDGDTGNEYKDIAFVIVSMGKNQHLDVQETQNGGNTIITYYKQGEKVNGYEFDDIIEFVTLAYLKSKVCSDVTSSHLPGSPTTELTFNDKDNPGGKLVNGAHITNDPDMGLVLNLTGNNDYLDVTHTVLNDTNNTKAPAVVCMWFKSNRDALNSAGMLFTITDNMTNTNTARQFYINTGDTTGAKDYDQLSVVRWNLPHKTRKLYDNIIKLWEANDGWHNLCVYCNGTMNGTFMYFDGLQLNTVMVNPDEDSGLFGGDWVKIITVGARVSRGNVDAEFDGYIDDFALYDRTTDYGQHFDICKAREIYNARANVGRDAVAYFPFNGDADDESGEDQLGHGHDGVLHNGPILAKDRFGCEDKAYNFDRSSKQWIEANSVAQEIDNKLTISAWIKIPAGYSGGQMCIAGFNTSTGGNRLLFMVNHTHHIALYDGDHGGWKAEGGNVADGQWHHVVLTYNSTNATIYVDGEVNATDAGATTTIEDDDKFSIGQEWDNFGSCSPQNPCTSDYFEGKIDDVAIFNSVLNATEIKNLYYGRRIDINYVPDNINTIIPPWNESDD